VVERRRLTAPCLQRHFDTTLAGTRVWFGGDALLLNDLYCFVYVCIRLRRARDFPRFPSETFLRDGVVGFRMLQFGRAMLVWLFAWFASWHILVRGVPLSWRCRCLSRVPRTGPTIPRAEKAGSVRMPHWKYTTPACCTSPPILPSTTAPPFWCPFPPAFMQGCPLPVAYSA